ncbi:MAG: MlaE family ABC transporter permease [Solirubrobacteraceae bacterium]
MAHLGVQALTRGGRPPYDYGSELVDQLAFVLKIAVLPLMLMSFALSFGPAGIQGSSVLSMFGALDRLGGVYVILVIREFAPLVSAIIVAAVAGTAICADLGARRIREEIDALSVLGVDPIRALVVPRLLALIVCCVIFNVLALLAGVAGAVAVVLQNDADLGPFFANFFAGATTLDLGLSFVKCALYGTVIGLICCHKGISASGGAEGVGRAVNQAVVISFLAIGVIDYAFSQFILATNPELSGLR